MIATPERKVWRLVAQSIGDPEQPDPDAPLGKRTEEVAALFAYKAEAEDWLADMERRGFAQRALMPCATFRYQGPTDARSNCWSARAEREVRVLALDGRGTVSVACAACGWDSDGRLTLVDRWVTDYPPIPYTGPIVEVYRDGDDPESRTIECEGCGGDLQRLDDCVEVIAHGRR